MLAGKHAHTEKEKSLINAVYQKKKRKVCEK